MPTQVRPLQQLLTSITKGAAMSYDAAIVADSTSPPVAAPAFVEMPHQASGLHANIQAMKGSWVKVRRRHVDGAF